ncbi:hypothetical protein ACFQWC_00240 [Rossellomorea sp. GCM10028870]|uniref:hypothetical protein n=1 Tax=Rossellomorea sp. GCM10028870 TaxID=3273426 RepID=UPI0036099F3E
MMKQVSKILLVLLLAFGAAFSFLSSASANAGTNDYQVSNPDVKTLTEKTYLTFDEDGTSRKINKSEAKEIEKLAKEQHQQKERKSLYNTKKMDLAALDPNKPSKSSDTEMEKAVASEVNYVEVTNNTIFDNVNKTVTLKVTITKIIGDPPVIVIAGYDLLSSKTLEGTYSKVTGFDVEWTGAQIYIGRTYSKTYNVTSTNFWMTQRVTTVGWLGSYPETDSGQAGPVLANKKATFYPVIQNNHSGQYMPTPTRADMAVVPLEDRSPWNNTLRGQYIASYIDVW